MASKIIKRFSGSQNFTIKPGSKPVKIINATIHEYPNKSLWVKGLQIDNSGFSTFVQAELNSHDEHSHKSILQMIF